MIIMVYGTLTAFLGNILGGFTTFGAACTEQTFFSLPTWYRYMEVTYSDVTKKCEVQFSLTTSGGVFNGDGIILLGLAIIDILIRVAGLVALAFVIYGGFRYMTSQGSPDGTKAALSTILNSVIGLLVAILAAAIVSFIGFSIG